MPGFENYARETSALEHEIARMGIALGIDWSDIVAVRLLAREALAYHPDGTGHGEAPLAKIELFGLAQLMLKVMRDSATENMEAHGGPVWKSFARALWSEAEGQGLVAGKINPEKLT